MAKYGSEAAERWLAEVWAEQGGRRPRDFAFYCRVAARPLADLDSERAGVAMARLSLLGGLPSRAEIAEACREAAREFS
jgi:hypothetical protein